MVEFSAAIGNCPVTGGVNAGNHVEDCGLAGPVGTDQAQYSAFWNLKVQVIHSQKTTESFGYLS
jgi:hypothetical protein